MFLKEFMKEVADIETAGEFIDPIIEEVGGEEVVGCITDPYLKALIIASEKWAKAYVEKLSQITEENELQGIREELNVLEKIVLAGIRLHLGVYKDTIGLRKGWTIVRKKEEQRPMPEVNILSEILRLTIPPDLLDVLGAAGDCSDPNCLIHGRKTITGQRKRRAEA